MNEDIITIDIKKNDKCLSSLRFDSKYLKDDRFDIIDNAYRVSLRELYTALNKQHLVKQIIVQTKLISTSEGE